MKLAKYTLMMVAKERDRCRCFEFGLKPTIKTPGITLATRYSYAELVEATLRIV